MPSIVARGAEPQGSHGHAREQQLPDDSGRVRRVEWAVEFANLILRRTRRNGGVFTPTLRAIVRSADDSTEIARNPDDREALALPHDGERSRSIAWWAYEQGEATGAHAWIDADRFVRLDGSWRDVLGPGPGAGALRLVAEPPPPQYRLE